ncbi:hypothetical protein [Jannaschia sp. R86511]|uniref:hypothetical protein n=1 Tax=Jannaschia sp. R86511 TaxID=3093853 RepID=UPI0036D20BFC
MAKSRSAFAMPRRAQVATVYRSDLTRGPERYDRRVRGEGEVARVLPISEHHAVRILKAGDHPQHGRSTRLFANPDTGGQLAPNYVGSPIGRHVGGIVGA